MKKVIVISVVLLSLLQIKAKENSEAVSDDLSQNKVDNETESDVEIPQKPSGYLIQPVSRKGTPMIVGTESPCSDIPKGNAHAIYTPGSLTRVAWKIEDAGLDANCSIYLFEGIGYYIPLKENFDCGRQTGVEFVFVKFPANMTCDHCSLQWVWDTYQGTLFQCVDIMVLDMEASCLGKCENGGVCLDGICLCPEGFYGPYCESNKEKSEEGGPSTEYFLIFMIMIILILILCCCIYFCTHPDKLPPGMQKSLYTKCPWMLSDQQIEQGGGGMYDDHQGIPGHTNYYPEAPKFDQAQGGFPFDDPAQM